MKSILYPLMLALVLAGCTASRSYSSCPKVATISIVDRNGMSEIISNKERLELYQDTDFLQPQPYQKVARVYDRDDQGTIRSEVTSYHDNGQVKQYLQTENGRAFGDYREWYPDGHLKIEAMVIGGDADISAGAQKTWLFEGENKVCDNEGHPQAVFTYSKGYLNGPSTYYHCNGNVWKEECYCQGLAQGDFKIYLETGGVLQTIPHSQGEKNGTSKRFWPTGDVAAEEYYEKGKLISATYTDLSGEIISSIKGGNGQRTVFGREDVAELREYKGGREEGLVQIFTRQGLLNRAYHIKEGLNQGEDVLYFPGTNKTKLSIHWYEGKMHGIARTWYLNGVIESQRVWADNQKNGLSSAWYQDGSLMLIEEYEKDKLMKGDYFRRGEKLPVTQILNGNGTATLFDAVGTFKRKVEYYSGKPS